MVLTLKPYNPPLKPNWDESSSLNFDLRVLDRLNNVILDFGVLARDVISYSDRLSVDATGSWSLKVKATSDNIAILRSLHPGLYVEFYCARNADPLENVLKNPASVVRKDSTPELPRGQEVSIRLPDVAGTSAADISSSKASEADNDIAFLRKTIEVAKSIGAKPADLLTAMLYESAGTLSPSIRGPYVPGDGKAVGLIQFMPSTANGLGTSAERLATLSRVEQLEYVRKYFQPFAGQLGSYYRLYATIHAGNPNASPNGSDGYRTTGEAARDGQQLYAAKARQLLAKATGPNTAPSPALTPIQAPSQAKVAVSPSGGDPAFAGKVIMQRTGTKDSQGLENLKLTVYDRSGKPISEHTVNSGIASTQTRFGGAFTTQAGSLAPVEFGKYRIGRPVVSGEEGVGRIFIPTDPTFATNRSAIGFHVDANRSTAPGSAGCIVFATESDFAKFQTALQQSGATTFEFLKTVTTVTTQNGTQTTTQNTDEQFITVEPTDDPYKLDQAPYLILRGVITGYGRATDGGSAITISGEDAGWIYRNSQVITDLNAPDAQSRAFEIRAAVQGPQGITVAWYRLLRDWCENWWSLPTGHEARTRVIPVPPNFLCRINQGGSVWQALKTLSIDGFFSLRIDETGALVWEKKPFSDKSQSLIAGRNWPDLPILDLPSWAIVSWADRLTEQGIQNYIRCTSMQAGDSTNISAFVYNHGSISQYGAVKREIMFPIGPPDKEQFYTSEPSRKIRATNTSFLTLCALEAIRFYDRPVQQVALTLRGDACFRVGIRLKIAEDWHDLRARGAEYYVIERSHNIDVANGSWTTNVDLLRDRRQRYLGIGVGEVPVIKGFDPKNDKPDITQTAKTDPLADWQKKPFVTATQPSGKLQKKPELFPDGSQLPKPELNVSLPQDDYWLFNRITGQVVNIGSDPIAYARKEVIPNLDKEPAVPVTVVLPKAGTGAIQTGQVATPAGKLGSVFASGSLRGDPFDPAGTIRGRPHRGCDMIPAGSGSGNLLAIGSGRVTRVVNSCAIGDVYCGDGFGNYVEVALDRGFSGWDYLYAHCSKILVSVGDTVRAGQVIAIMGDTGHSFGDHLHVEIRKAGAHQDPDKFISGIVGTYPGTRGQTFPLRA